MTPEEIAVSLCRSMWQVCSSAVDISQDEEVKAIATAIRDAVEEEREACATLCETEASEITMTRISAAIGSAQHAQMRAEAKVCRDLAERIRGRQN
jgi:hypothetical protein